MAVCAFMGPLFTLSPLSNANRHLIHDAVCIRGSITPCIHDIIIELNCRSALQPTNPSSCSPHCTPSYGAKSAQLHYWYWRPCALCSTKLRPVTHAGCLWYTLITPPARVLDTPGIQIRYAGPLLPCANAIDGQMHPPLLPPAHTSVPLLHMNRMQGPYPMQIWPAIVSRLPLCSAAQCTNTQLHMHHAQDALACCYSCCSPRWALKGSSTLQGSGTLQACIS